MTDLLAATFHGVVRLSQSGGRWSAERTLDGDARCLALAGPVVFAGLDGHGVFRSEDGGVRWENVGLSGLEIRSLAARGDLVLAGTREPRVHASRDRGATWEPLAPFPRWRSWWWVQPAERPFRPSFVSALAVTERAVVAGIEACGVLVSRDGGGSWSRHRRRALRDCHQLEVSGSSVYEAGSGGLAESRDDGLTWRRRRAGLDLRYGWSVATDGAETLYLAAAPYRTAHLRNARARILRSRDGGAWQSVTGELASLPRLAVGAPGSVFAALGDGSLLHSGDRGDTWSALPVDVGGWSRALVVTET